MMDPSSDSPHLLLNTNQVLNFKENIIQNMEFQNYDINNRWLLKVLNLFIFSFFKFLIIDRLLKINCFQIFEELDG